MRGRVTKVNSQVKVQGHLSKEAVSRVVNDHTHEVQGCYERQLLKQQGLAGRIVFEWTVTADGSVRNARTASSTLPSVEVADCIVAKIRKWRFPAPDGGDVVISYPFLFRSVGG